MRSVGSGDQTWRTPQALFDGLSKWYGDFTFDLAASPQNAKCERYFTVDDDALKQSWSGLGTCFVNPPFRLSRKFAAKAVEEVALDRQLRVVMLCQAAPNALWFYDAITSGYLSAWCFFRGRVSYVPPMGQESRKTGSPSVDSMVLVFHGGPGSEILADGCCRFGFLDPVTGALID